MNTINDDDQPIVKMLVPHKQNADMISGGGPAQTIARDIKIQEGAFQRLMVEPSLAKQFDDRLNEAERLHKTMKYSIYD